MRLCDLLQRWAKQSPQQGDEQQHPAAISSVERMGGILHQAIDHTNPPTTPNYGSSQQYPLLGQAFSHDETSQSVAVKVWSDVLQAAVWVVQDNLPRTEWPQDGPVYTQGEIRMLTKVGHDVLEWVNPVKEIFNARIVVAHGTTKGNPSSYRHQQSVDV